MTFHVTTATHPSTFGIYEVRDALGRLYTTHNTHTEAVAEAEKMASYTARFAREMGRAA